MEIGEQLNLQEIEAAFKQFNSCPKCNSSEGFWLELKRDQAYVQCKGCGAKFELCEVYTISGNGKTPERLKLLKKLPF